MKPRVMLIIPEMCVGGAQRSLAKLSIELSKHATIFFVIFNRSHPIAYTFAGQLFTLDVQPKSGWYGKTFSFFQRVRRLKKLKKKLGIQVAISFLEGADYVNVLSRIGEKVIISIRGSKLHDEVMRSYLFWFRSKILIPFLYRRSDLVVTVNQGIANELTQVFQIPERKVTTIYNFYDVEEIKNLSSEPHEGSSTVYKSPVLITSGRLAPEKRLPFLLQVFVALKRYISDVRFIFVGDGPERTTLSQFCKDGNLNVSIEHFDGLDPDVIFLRNQSNVFKYLKGASVYLLNSSSEGFPNGLVEAMICGVPVIAADCPYGPREILAPNLKISDLHLPHVNSMGILMPLENSQQAVTLWAETIAELLRDTALRDRLSVGGQKRVLDFNKDNIIAQWLGVIQTPTKS